MEELFKAGMAEYGYKRGREDEKAEWLDTVLPETMVVTIRVRTKDDKVEQIKTVFTFEEMTQGNVPLLQKVIENTFKEIATKGKILPNLISNPT